MKKSDKKFNILQILKKESNAIAVSELSKKCKNISVRTIRRLLKDLIEEGFVKKEGKGKNTRYSAINKNLQNEIFSKKSLSAIKYINQPIYKRKPVAYNSKWFEGYKPNITSYLSGKLKKELKKSGRLAKDKISFGTYAHQIFNRMLIDLSYNSSRLEGNTYSLLETKRLLFFGKKAKGKLDQEKVMILNHKEAIRYLIENSSKLKINIDIIRTIHYLLSDGLIEPKYAGNIRDDWVRISGSTYMPFTNQEKLKNQLIKIVSKADKIKDPFEQSLFLLIHITYLQPFLDVNKRTARICANIPLIKNNLIPISFNDIEKDSYISAMISIYELQNIRPLIDLFSFSYIKSSFLYHSTITAIGFDEVRVRYRKERREITGKIISKKLIGSKMVEFIKKESKRNIPKKYQKNFIKDVLEDIKMMNQSKTAGLGITKKELNSWLKEYKKNPLDIDI